MKNVYLMIGLLFAVPGTTAFGNVVSVIAAVEPAALDLSRGSGMESYVTRASIPAEHPAFSTAQRFSVVRTPQHSHQLQVQAASVRDLAEGETLLARITLRSGDPNRDAVRVPFFVQDRQAGFRSIFDERLVVGQAWETHDFVIPIRGDMAAGRLQFCLFLGETEQTLDLGRFEVIMMGQHAARDAVSRPDAAVSVSVQGEYAPVNASRSSITGSLPGGWEEDSSWADVGVNYRAQTLNPFDGDRSLRVEISEVRQGSVQFRIPKVRVLPSHMIRLRIPVRSEDHLTGTVALRQRGAPYAVYWENSLSARPEWGVIELLASVRDTDPEATLMFSFSSPGTFEIGDFAIEYLTPEQALAGQSFEGNLLQSSSFPLGLTAPWAIGANGTTEEHLRADPDHPGPSGLPSLRLETNRYEGRPMMQITAPFIGRPGESHTLSFWAKSERPGMRVHMRMGPPRESLWRDPWQKDALLTTEWRRYEMTVQLPPAPDMLYLARFTSHDLGVFWIDQVMVEQSEAAGPFQTTGPVEVYAVPAREWGLSFEDEPLSVRLAMHGQIDQVDRVKVEVLDLYGERTELPPLPPEQTELTLPDIQTLGSFLVTLTAVDAQDQRLGHPAEVLLHRVRQPRRWGEIAFDSPFGTHVASTPTATRMAKALGFNWNRMHYKFNWTGLQRPDGSWNFDGADARIAPHKENDLLILTHFGGVPKEHSTRRPEWQGNTWYHMTAAPQMSSMDAFEEYCRRLLEHAGDSLQAVETWNEPFLAGFFVADVVNGRPVRERPEVLAELNRRARSAVEASGYTGLLMWNVGPHYGDSERGFDEAARDLGAADSVDALSFHRYTNARLGFPGDQFDLDLSVINEVFADHSAASTIWNSEGGHGLSEVFNLYQNIPPFGHRARVNAQAAQYVRYFLSNFAAGVEKVFIYTLYPQDGWLSNYGYLNVDGVLSHIAPVTSNMAWQLEGKRFAGARNLHDGIHAQLYAGETENTVVFLPTGRGEAVLHHTVPGLRIDDLWGNPAEPPRNFVTGLLYLSAPGLTLDQASELLNASSPPAFRVVSAEPEAAAPAAAPSSPRPAPAEAGDGNPVYLVVILVLAALVFLPLFKNRSGG
ncbi:MAG: hypothetical protein JJU05_04495 [Verrucomicrobia bacterium]|nr:hypothetical protein [Verrucomicrobiota bacterium]MCH8525592.1 hypothetical protein [Kiritimatiellia bacterium]